MAYLFLSMVEVKHKPPHFLILTTVAIFIFAIAAGILFFRGDEFTFTKRTLVEAPQ